jgi:hypothetical protein
MLKAGWVVSTYVAGMHGMALNGIETMWPNICGHHASKGQKITACTFFKLENVRAKI